MFLEKHVYPVDDIEVLELNEQHVLDSIEEIHWSRM
jgi:hypothetical protein